jgi:hypothetical protein
MTEFELSIPGHAGEWVALIHNKVVASSKDFNAQNSTSLASNSELTGG